jgi:hypothetical protein
VRCGHQVVVITDTLEDEGSSFATFSKGDVAQKGVVGDNPNNGGRPIHKSSFKCLAKENQIKYF